MHPNRAITYWHKHPQLLRLNVLVNQFLNSHSFTRREQQPSGINTPNDKVLAVVPKFSWHGGDVAVGSGLRCMTPVRRTDGRTLQISDSCTRANSRRNWYESRTGPATHTVNAPETVNASGQITQNSQGRHGPLFIFNHGLEGAWIVRWTRGFTQLLNGHCKKMHQFVYINRYRNLKSKQVL